MLATSPRSNSGAIYTGAPSSGSNRCTYKKVVAGNVASIACGVAAAELAEDLAAAQAAKQAADTSSTSSST